MLNTALPELALLAIFAVHGAIEVLEPYHQLREQEKRSLLVRKSGWYASYAHELSAADFQARFRIWPSALYELVCRFKGWELCAMDDCGWQRCLRTDEAKFICHASYYLVTGMCIFSSAKLNYVHVNLSFFALQTAPFDKQRLLWILLPPQFTAGS